MNAKIQNIVKDNQTAILANMPKIIEEAAIKRVDDYLAKFYEMVKQFGSVMVHTEPILRTDFQEAVKSRIKGEPDTIILPAEENELADKMADEFIQRALEFYTAPHIYQAL